MTFWEVVAAVIVGEAIADVASGFIRGMGRGIAREWRKWRR